MQIQNVPFVPSISIKYVNCRLSTDMHLVVVTNGPCSLLLGGVTGDEGV